MKALEVLKRSLDSKQGLKERHRYENDVVFKSVLDYEIAEHEEAIKELEDLIAKDKQKNCEECYDKADKAIEAQQSCDGCIYLENRDTKDEFLRAPCDECKRFYIPNLNYFYNDKYTRKVEL